jgi:hypothetical protein
LADIRRIGWHPEFKERLEQHVGAASPAARTSDAFVNSGEMHESAAGALDARTLFNPAFVGTLIGHAGAGHQRDFDTPLPMALTFLVAPLVLHAPTREALPSLNGRLAKWADRHSLLRSELQRRAPAFTPITRLGLRFGARAGLLAFEPPGVMGGSLLGDCGQSSTDDVAGCRVAAEHVGRWLPRAGPPSTIYALLGLRP